MKKKKSRLEKRIRDAFGWVKKRRSVPAELSGRVSGGRSAVVYLGNGAAVNEYDALFTEQTEAGKGKAFHGLGGIYNECAIWYAPRHHFKAGTVKVHQRFRHASEEARFDGFILRKKRRNQWLWYLTDGRWTELSAEMGELQHFHEGDLLPPMRKTGVYVLEARWKDTQGRLMNCGYRMFQNKVMAHAFGGMDGQVYLNTRAALEHSIKQGFRYFETDMTMTADGKLVLIHGWQKTDCARFGIPYDRAYRRMTYEMVRKLRIHGEQVMDAREFFSLMAEQPSAFCYEIDPHHISPEKLEKVVASMLQDMGDQRERLLERLLFQVYNRSMYWAADAVHHFEVYQYNIHNHIEEIDKIISFCLDNGICSVAIRAGEVRRETIQKLKNAGLYVLAYTIDNDLSYAKTMLAYGADTICTNFITEQALRNHGEQLGAYPYRLVYNSGEAEALSAYAQEARRDSSGALEVEEKELWANTAEQGIAQCKFSLPGKRFLGWQLRVIRDGHHQYWYCKDGLFRTRIKFVEGTNRVPLLFPDGAILPVIDVHKGDAVVLVAVYGA